MPIRSFKDRRTEALFRGDRVREYDGFRPQAERRLLMLDNASSLSSLASVPGNRLEALRGGRKGQHSIRINDQWRVCFVWTNKGPTSVEIVDYH
jgi:proteic killer suppression protein